MHSAYFLIGWSLYVYHTICHMAQEKNYWRMLGSFLSGLFPPWDSSFWNFCCLKKFKLQFFHSKTTESVQNIMLIPPTTPLHLFVPRCESANTLRTKKLREVCFGWTYYPYCQDLCPLSSDCSWSVFEVFKHCFLPFFPKFYRRSLWRDQSKH